MKTEEEWNKKHDELLEEIRKYMEDYEIPKDIRQLSTIGFICQLIDLSANNYQTALKMFDFAKQRYMSERGSANGDKYKLN